MYNKKDYIHYRIERSQEMFDDALLLADKNRWKSCVNRLYYSCFQLIDALLYMKNLRFKTHIGLKNNFFQHFVKTGIIDKEFGKLLLPLYSFPFKYIIYLCCLWRQA